MGKTDRNTQALPLWHVHNFDTSGKAINLNRTLIPSVLHDFDAGDCTRPQIAEYGFPVIRRPVTQLKCHARFRAGMVCGSFSPQCARRPVKEVLEYFIESPQAAESRGERNFSHGHSRFVNQMLSKQHTPGLCHRDGRGSKMLHEQSPELALA